ncbi:MAG: glutamine-hydrolyzing GMP synthase [Candidatus Wallbacteria bacterium]|nr:glutamine-hydrolyzing GMP synthase [Candidatus Wallbacteria bacterium]
MILIIDFGSQYTKLIARKIRQLGVYSLIVTPESAPREIKLHEPEALIFSGGPASVYAKGAPTIAQSVVDCGLPILGICYGLQLICRMSGGLVERSSHREFGKALLRHNGRSPLFRGLDREETVWMSHGDKVTALPAGFRAVAGTANCENAAVVHDRKKIFGLQFHPEVVHTPCGATVLSNFIKTNKITLDWKLKDFIREKQALIKAQVGSGKVLLALSGGVDSATLALFLHQIIPGQIIPVMVNTGLLRDEDHLMPDIFRKEYGLSVKFVDASKVFLSRLSGVTDPEQKRKIIGHTFIEVFEKEALRHKGVKFLAQGTLYPDVIESAGGNKLAAKIKSHHNVGGLPERLPFSLIEPFRELFKDEVRVIARKIGLLPELVGRHPFPGPGLAVRIIGEITEERLAILRKADAIFIEELKTRKLYNKVWQSFCVLLPVQSVGVMGDERTYESLLALRSVGSVDGMTAEWSRLPLEFLAHVSSRIINEVRGVNRVVYDISSKPPSTIEWE